MDRERSLKINKEELIHYLRLFNIPFETWGTGESKTLDHLLHELNEGESLLIEQKGQIHRIVEGVGLNVYYPTGEVLLRLHEDRQVFNNGRIRRRKLLYSISEKLKLHEPAIDGAFRCLEEELGILYANFTSLKIENRNPIPSTSFPGLWSKGLVFVFETHLIASDFKPEGYIEYQEDKTTYFVWRNEGETGI